MNPILNKATVMILILLSSAAAYAGDMYKWKDENGQTHYGNLPSEAKRNAAEKVKLIDNTMVPPAKPEDVSGRDREMRKQDDKAATPPPPQKTEQDDSNLSKCEREMKKYRESQECFAPYRNATGGIKEEGYQHCTEVPQPAMCN